MPGLSGLAARLLGWRPDTFWNATPAELAAALGIGMDPASPGAIDRATLQRLMEHDHDR
ncbi:hypothetical protein B2G71_00435 [Novosphingobium sp. PC22D]|nr:hypothetical protein B2G71_00435 [Novosphingobium sp. PC22D]